MDPALHTALSAYAHVWPETIRVRPTVPVSPASAAEIMRDRPTVRVYLDAHDVRVAAQRLLGHYAFAWVVRSLCVGFGEPFEAEVYVLRTGHDFEEDASAMRALVQSIVNGECPQFLGDGTRANALSL